MSMNLVQIDSLGRFNQLWDLFQSLSNYQ
jgi:hypothetical protein